MQIPRIHLRRQIYQKNATMESIMHKNMMPPLCETVQPLYREGTDEFPKQLTLGFKHTIMMLGLIIYLIFTIKRVLQIAW